MTASTPQDGCSANSFMMNDGICDELTNSKRCLYDGGDCCRQEKSTPLCEVCTCKLETNFTALKADFDALDVIVLFSNAVELPKREVVTIEDVESTDVCSRICMDSKTTSLADDWKISKAFGTRVWRNNVNAWSVQLNGTCQCLTILTPLCQANASLTDYHRNASNPIEELFFIQRSKTIPCGNFLSTCNSKCVNDCLYVDCLQHDRKFETTKKARVFKRKQPSSWHCQQECKVLDDCLYFSTNTNTIMGTIKKMQFHTQMHILHVIRFRRGGHLSPFQDLRRSWLNQ